MKPRRMGAGRDRAVRSKLATYRSKRHFNKTREPAGEEAAGTSGDAYLIQKHAASRLHYDFRLELGGVLKSWAVTRGPSLNPEDKRLAVQVEDHPLEYGSFEGTIPQGEYGGGTVMLWDRGTWQAIGNADRDLARGKLTFILHGRRLKGRWHLVRLRSRRPGDSKRDNWLLIKGKDEYADADGKVPSETFQNSVVSRRSMEGIARASGKTWGKTGARRKSAAEAADAVEALKKKARASSTRLKAPDVGRGDAPAAFVAPQLATLVSAPPSGENWVHEIKFDGYRLLTVIAGQHAEMFTRAANDWSDRFKPFRAAFTKLKLASAIIDGEAVHVAQDGSMSFHGLQNALSTGKLDGVRYYAFDLLHLNGVDLRARPLTERKALLQKIMAGAPDRLLYSEHFAEAGDQVLRQACSLALEGIVSKRADAPYRSGRTDSWLKSKCLKEQELVIGGYTEQPKHPGVLGALLVGYFDGDRLRFAGKIGTGFTQAEARALIKKLQERGVRASPFASLPTDARRGARFIRPEVVAHVNFSEWTPDGKLRHPSFQGLREDKPAREVVRENAKPLSTIAKQEGPSPMSSAQNERVANVIITHPNRVLWQDLGLTKLELARYYEAIAPRLLAHAGNRPISLVRCPNGAGGQCFFQRHVTDGMSSHVHAVKVAGRGEGKAYIYVSDAEGLVSLVQMGTIELHAWNATVDDVKHPDRITFDLDPAPGVAWEAVKSAARQVRATLKTFGLVSFLKTTGGKGLHVVVPFARGPRWAEAKQFARAVSNALARDEPDRFTINSRKNARKDRIFIDYLRNDETASAIAAYAVRARPGAPVSLPIGWKELSALESAAVFGIKDAVRRRADPWKGIAAAATQVLPVGAHHIESRRP
jgi:bifunctional non-homologous end joining protein LigD